MTSFFSDDFLDTYELPIGEWAETIINWMATQLAWLWDAIRAPIDWLLELVIDDILLGVSWVVVVLVFFFIGWYRRGLKVGIGAGVGLVICGLLGNGFWSETMETLGMILVAVGVCVLIGLPLGIVAARSDRFEGIIRPVLDAMQTIHPFVYLLPIVFLFGTGRTPGVLATIIFAMPPIVRLDQPRHPYGPLGRSGGRACLRGQQPSDPARRAAAARAPEHHGGAEPDPDAGTVDGGHRRSDRRARAGPADPARRQHCDIPLAVTSGLAVLILAVVLDRISTVSDNDEEPGIRTSLQPHLRRVLHQAH